MGAIHDWATPENLQPEPITVEIWRDLPEEFCRQVEVVYVLDHAIEAYRLLRTLAPEDEVSVLEVPVRIKVPWSQLSALVR